MTETSLGAAGRRRRAHAYGCPAGADLSEDGITQLRLANRLWNALVEIERAHEAAKAEIWSRDPAAAAAQGAAGEAGEMVAALGAELRQARQADRTTVPRDADRGRLAAARAALQSARETRDTARAAALPLLASAFKAAQSDRDAAVKATYAAYVQQEGLGWATWNDVVLRRLPAAREKVAEAREKGGAAQLRFRRFDGTGTLTVQLQRESGSIPAAERDRIAVLAAGSMRPGEAAAALAAEGFPARDPRAVARIMRATAAGEKPAKDKAGDPVRSPGLLASGEGKWRNVLQLSPWADPDEAGRPKGAARHGTLTAGIGRGRGWGALAVTIPVVLDSWLPAGADVCEVKITRRKLGSHYRLQCAIVFTEPAPPPPRDGASVAVRLGWASHGGNLLAARIGSTVPLPPLPPRLDGIVTVAPGGRSAEVWYPAAWRKLLERDAGIRSVRDEMLDVMKDAVSVALKDDEALAAGLELSAADVARWRSHGRMARLGRQWPPDHPLAADLAEWRKRDRHLLDFEGNERAQVLAGRRDVWRCVAAWLCSAARAVIIDDLDLAAIRQAPGPGSEDPVRRQHGRAQMHQAAPGEFRAAVENAARKRCIPVVKAAKLPPGKQGKDR